MDVQRSGAGPVHRGARGLRARGQPNESSSGTDHASLARSAAAGSDGWHRHGAAPDPARRHVHVSLHAPRRGHVLVSHAQQRARSVGARLVWGDHRARGRRAVAGPRARVRAERRDARRGRGGRAPRRSRPTRRSGGQRPPAERHVGAGADDLGRTGRALADHQCGRCALCATRDRPSAVPDPWHWRWAPRGAGGRARRAARAWRTRRPCRRTLRPG